MAKPSDNWPGFSDIDSESEKYTLIQKIISTADFEYLKTCALNSRRKDSIELPSDLKCSINLTNFATGFQNVVLELTFSDDVYWIARIPYRGIDKDSKTSLLSEIATMNFIHQRTSIPVPQVFQFEISTDNPFGYPYVLMECLHGRILDDGLATAVPLQHRNKVAKQFAKILWELQNLTFDRIGQLWRGETADQPVQIIPMGWHATPGPLGTSLEYYYNQRQDENRQTMHLHPNEPEWLAACWVMNTALPHIIIEDRVKGPFPLCHLDLHFRNILLDNEYNISGIIDWSSAQAAPLEQLSVSPEFMIFTGLSDEENRPIVEFRHLVVKALEELENAGPGSATLNDQEIISDQHRKLIPLSAYLATDRAEIALRAYMMSPKTTLFAAERVAKLIFEDKISWEQLKRLFGIMPLIKADH